VKGGGVCCWTCRKDGGFAREGLCGDLGVIVVL